MSQTQRNTVQTPGEAISVLVQVAELAQSKGILSFDDAVIVKSAIDFLRSLTPPSEPTEETTEEGPKA
jgi:hypothetical protein